MLVGHVGVVGDDAHAPRRHELRHAAADAPQTDQPQHDALVAVLFPSAQVYAGKRLAAPRAARLQVLVPLPRVLEQRQHLGHGGLRDAAPVRLRRRVGDQDAELRRRVHVDLVHADGVLGDDAQPLGRREHVAGDLRALDGRAGEGVGAGGHLGQPLRRVAGGVAPVGASQRQRTARRLELLQAVSVGGRKDEHFGLRHDFLRGCVIPNHHAVGGERVQAGDNPVVLVNARTGVPHPRRCP